MIEADLDDEELEWTLKKLNKQTLHWKKEELKEKEQKEDNNETETKNK